MFSSAQILLGLFLPPSFPRSLPPSVPGVGHKGRRQRDPRLPLAARPFVPSKAKSLCPPAPRGKDRLQLSATCAGPFPREGRANVLNLAEDSKVTGENCHFCLRPGCGRVCVCAPHRGTAAKRSPRPLAACQLLCKPQIPPRSKTEALARTILQTIREAKG